MVENMETNIKENIKRGGIMYSKNTTFTSGLVAISHELDEGLAVWTESAKGSTFLHISEEDMYLHKEAMLGLAQTIEQFYQDKDVCEKLRLEEMSKVHN